MLTQNLQGILEQYLNITGIHKLFLALKIRQLRKSGKVLMFYTVHVTCTVLQYMDTVIIRQKKKQCVMLPGCIVKNILRVCNSQLV